MNKGDIIVKTTIRMAMNPPLLLMTQQTTPGQIGNCGRSSHKSFDATNDTMKTTYDHHQQQQQLAPFPMNGLKCPLSLSSNQMLSLPSPPALRTASGPSVSTVFAARPSTLNSTVASVSSATAAAWIQPATFKLDDGCVASSRCFPWPTSTTSVPLDLNGVEGGRAAAILSTAANPPDSFTIRRSDDVHGANPRNATGEVGIDARMLEPVPIEPSRVTVVPKVDIIDMISTSQELTNESMLAFLRPLVECSQQQQQESQESKPKKRAPSADEYLRQHKRCKRAESKTKTEYSYFVHLRTAPIDEDAESSSRIRNHQEAQWEHRFKELQIFKERSGHCSVPHTFKDFPQLAQWVKRQRYQFKLKMEGRHSTLTRNRQQRLDDVGFVWDSHHGLWEQKYQELLRFEKEHGHCTVPTRFKDNPSLAVWVKCQRRQYKLMKQGRRSNITQQRVDRLNELGFCWNPRSLA